MPFVCLFFTSTSFVRKKRRKNSARPTTYTTCPADCSPFHRSCPPWIQSQPLVVRMPCQPYKKKRKRKEEEIVCPQKPTPRKSRDVPLLSRRHLLHGFVSCICTLQWSFGLVLDARWDATATALPACTFTASHWSDTRLGRHSVIKVGLYAVSDHYHNHKHNLDTHSPTIISLYHYYITITITGTKPFSKGNPRRAQTPCACSRSTEGKRRRMLVSL